MLDRNDQVLNKFLSTLMKLFEVRKIEKQKDDGATPMEKEKRHDLAFQVSRSPGTPQQSGERTGNVLKKNAHIASKHRVV
jgi:hypothetical protein